MSTFRRTWALILAALMCAAPAAFARNGGIATLGCEGCHSGGQTPQASITTSQNNPQPGATLTVTVTIPAVNGGTGGVYLRSNGPGQFTLISGQSTRLVNQDELVHSTPKSPVNGNVTFQVMWTAPATKGGVDFDAWVVASNGNGGSSGDGSGYARRSLAYGCAGTTYYRDLDGDGVGSATSGTSLACDVAPTGYSAQSGDCNDNDEFTFPGKVETCNHRDDDCDGSIDEGLPVQAFYEDADGDGHGILGGATKMDCGPSEGFAALSDDCVDTDKNRHPGADEVCNFVDDDCDGRIDEGARVTCGVGMCARYGLTCDATLCTPGKPEPELCNYLDDDCDGVIDNAATCSSGLVCSEGRCVEGSAVPDAGVDPGTTDGGSTTRPDAEPAVGCSSVPALSGGLMLLAVFVGLGVTRRRRR